MPDQVSIGVYFSRIPVEKARRRQKGPIPSTRASNSMRAQLTRPQLPPAQILAAILLSLSFLHSRVPSSPYLPSTPSPPNMTCTAHSHLQVFHPNYPMRNTLHPPRTAHTKHPSPLPAMLDGNGLLQMSFKRTTCTTPKVKQSRIRAEHSHTRHTRKPQNTHEPHTKRPRHNDKTQTRAETTALRTCKTPRSPIPNLNLPPTL